MYNVPVLHVHVSDITLKTQQVNAFLLHVLTKKLHTTRNGLPRHVT